MLYQSKQIVGLLPVPNPTEAGEETAVISEFVVPAALALGDVIEMCGIPDNAFITEVLIFHEAADSNASKTLSFDIGFLTGPYARKDQTRNCDSSFASADLTSQNGGVARMSQSAGYFLPSHTDGAVIPGNITVGFGLKVHTAAATLVPGARIRLLVRVMPSVYGIT